MNNQPILQIVSGFKPSVDGMGDFSRILGAALYQQHSISSHFLVYRRPQTPLDPALIAPNTISYPENASPDSLSIHLANLTPHYKTALFHWGPYAYSSSGTPGAFIRIIESIASKMRVLVFFHEVFATGYPWQRAFWTSPEQRRCVDTLLEIADPAFTSNSSYILRLLRRNKTGSEITKIPIFSNVGEPTNLPAIPTRERRLVIFGQQATRNRLYKNHRPMLEQLCRQLQIKCVVDVGSGDSQLLSSTLASAKVEYTGRLEEEQISRLMADSIAGVIGYWPDVWEKSGVLASYAAHGMLPIMLELEARHIPQPAFVPYLQPEEISRLVNPDGLFPDTKIESFASSAHEYYLRNQSAAHCASTIASAIEHPKTGRPD